MRLRVDRSMMTEFLQKESTGGILLMAATAVAMVVANTPLDGVYRDLLSTKVEVRIGGAFELSKVLLLWINDGLMAIFFFLVGLELKRELVEGELSDRRAIALPAFGAIGGMAVPALIYVAVNVGDSTALRGWATPAATDIAFALGILALLGSRVPVALKVFLTSLAIFDDVGAIVIIALFYTEGLSLRALIVAVAALATAMLLNRSGVTSKSAYLLVGIVMWAAMIKSGVHATLAGVLIALTVPLRSKNPDESPLKELEHDLHDVIAFFVLPVFAFANAGISFAGVGGDQLLHGVPLGIAAGLFFGKQAGVFGLCWVAVKMRVATLPADLNLKTLYGAAALCGVGFTMSLFIGSLAFGASVAERGFDERIGIIAGSLASGAFGYLALSRSLPGAPQEGEPEGEAATASDRT